MYSHTYPSVYVDRKPLNPFIPTIGVGIDVGARAFATPCCPSNFPQNESLRCCVLSSLMPYFTGGYNPAAFGVLRNLI